MLVLNTKLNIDFIVSSYWQLTFYLFLEQVLTAVLISFSNWNMNSTISLCIMLVTVGQVCRPAVVKFLRLWVLSWTVPILHSRYAATYNMLLRTASSSKNSRRFLNSASLLLLLPLLCVNYSGQVTCLCIGIRREGDLSTSTASTLSGGHWVTLTFDLAFRSAIRWAKP